MELGSRTRNFRLGFEVSALIYLFSSLLLGAIFPQSADAIQASPRPFLAEQPDGLRIRLRIRGDEHFHWSEDLDGFTVIRDRGKYVYAVLDSNGKLSPSQLPVGRTNPRKAGLLPRILPSRNVLMQRSSFSMSQLADSSPPAALSSPVGTIKNLVVMIRFSNHTSRVLPSNSDIDTLFNAVGGDVNLAPTGSVKDAYLENSYNQLTLNSTVVGWIDVPYTEQYCADEVSGDVELWEALTFALDQADATINFNQFDEDSDNSIDAIAFIHSGYGAEWGGTDDDGTFYTDRIWSHRWSIQPAWTSAEGVQVSDYHISPGLWDTLGSNIGRIGVICHETGHFFGLPDLYDTTEPGSGIGSWGMMANSWGFDGTQLHPPHFCAWSKIALGWVTPTVILPGPYDINQVETEPAIFRINNGYPADEYLLIENRQPVGLETDMPQGGLCIFHIDDQADYDTEGYPGQAGWPGNGNHYRVALLQADGNYNLEKENNRGDPCDPYHAAGVSTIGPLTVPNTDAYQNGTIIVTDNTITQISAAGATMSFVFTLGDDLSLVPTESFSSIGSVGGSFDPNSKIYTLTNDGNSPVPWTASNTESWLDVTPAAGTLASANSVPVTVSLNANADSLPEGTFTDAVIFTNTLSGYQHTRNVSLEVINIIYDANMTTDPLWTLDPGSGSSKWQWGTPQGNGGQHGNPDPSSGYTGSNVIGYNLLGDYASSIGSTQWATTPAVDCSLFENIQLRFYRWLNVEQSAFDHAYIEVSNNGSTWSRIWQNSAEVSDSSWTLQTFDISSIGDNESTVYVRWGMGPTDASWRYSGWNIDDVRITGDVADPKPPTAENLSLAAEIAVPTQITLHAKDDGRPDPPAALIYIISSLPNYGILSDPCDGTIVSGDVPYTLAAGGDKVIYISNACFTGSDSFGFKANDGGTGPSGGDSNIATVSLNVRKTIFTEDFTGGLGNFTIDNIFGDGSGLWHLTTSCESTSLDGHTAPNSLYYGIDAQCNYNAGQTEGIVTSPSIDLTTLSDTVELRFNYFLETEGIPASWDIATVEVSQNGGPFNMVAGNSDASLSDPSQTWLPATIDLSAMAGSDIQIRFRFRTVDSLVNNHFGFYVDDVRVSGTSIGILGDFEGNCDVNLPDFVVLASAWSSTPIDDNWNPLVDISDPNDNLIDELDLAVFIENWLSGSP